MNLLHRLGNAWEALVARSGPGAGATSGSTRGGSDWTDAFRSRRALTPRELVEAFKGVVYSCATLNALAVARVPLRLYATTGQGQAKPRCLHRSLASKERDSLNRRVDATILRSLADQEVDEVLEHPLLDALASCNEHFDYNLLIAYTVLCLDIVGPAYWRPAGVRVEDVTVPREIWPLPPHLVTPIPGTGRAGQVIAGYTYEGETLTPDAVVRFRHVDLREPYLGAYSPARASAAHWGLEDKWVAIQDTVLGAGPRPSMIVSAKDPLQPLGEDAARRLEAKLNRHSGGGAGRAWVEGTGALDVKNLTYAPSDLSGTTVSEYAIERTANTFGVPVSMLTSKDVNRANAEAGEYQHATRAVDPRCKLIASVLTRRLAQPLDGRLFFAFDNPVPSDKERDAKLFDMAVKNGTLTINEARAEQGWDEVDWGEEPWLPQTLRQPSEERPAPPQPPGSKPPGMDPDKPEDDAEKAMVATLTRTLARLERALEADDIGAGCRDGRAWAADLEGPAPDTGG